MTAYYNELDPYAAQWLRNLIAAGHIADGVVDERSIADVQPADLSGFTQCHFFAGIGVWSHALRRAGWADDRPVWTGSCPCQPFSSAGKQTGTADERHLWPVWFDLIRQCRPAVVFGEQVEAAIRHGWLDLVQSDMEGSGYAFAAAGIPAAGVGAPHIRQRLWFVADTGRTRGERWENASGLAQIDEGQRHEGSGNDQPRGGTGRLGNNNNTGLEGLGRGHQAESGHGQGEVRPVAEAGELGGMADAAGRLDERGIARPDQRPMAGSDGTTQAQLGSAGPTNGHWRDADWLFCRDGKWRPTQSINEPLADGIADSLGYVCTGQDSYGLSPLIHGARSRVGRLRAYGNAIVSSVAQEFIAAYMSVRP